MISYKSGDNGSKLQSTIASFMDLTRNGKIIPEILRLFYGATLTALSKKENDIRPIAVGLVWRRLAGKIAVFSVADVLSNKLRPFQLGFGTEEGCDAIIHALRYVTE